MKMRESEIAQTIADLAAGVDLEVFMNGASEGLGMVFASVKLPQDVEFAMVRGLSVSIIGYSALYKEISAKAHVDG